MDSFRHLLREIRVLPLLIGWRLARWVRDYHESRYFGGPISDELVEAQRREYEAREILTAALHRPPRPSSP